ncbi:MAG TPA: hypothetical protein VGR28_10775 [Candidatus Thermoplasmatota archaeon]|jgi:hypothetical protein|nr:hypothetical protein [Candidatus Thermoplasmatota archaeon]
MNLKQYLGSVGYRLSALGLGALGVAALPLLAGAGKPSLGLAAAATLALLALLSALEARVTRQRARGGR